MGNHNSLLTALAGPGLCPPRLALNTAARGILLELKRDQVQALRMALLSLRIKREIVTMASKGLRDLVPGLLYLTFITTTLHSSHEGLLPLLRLRALHSLTFLPYNTVPTPASLTPLLYSGRRSNTLTSTLHSLPF